MRVTWTTMLPAALTMGHALAQGMSEHVSTSIGCIELNQTVTTQVNNGQIGAAEALLSTAIASGADGARNGCAGLVLNNMAALLSISGRLVEAERLAERSVKILEATYPPNDIVLLRPLSILAATRFEQGKTARAREAFQHMRSIGTERPADRALLHATAAVLLEAEGRRREAEAEYFVTLRAWEESGRGETAEVAAIFNSLGSLYIEEQRFDEARQALDRALTIFSHAKDTVPMDHIKLLNVRGVLHARQGAWLDAEQDFSDALAMADREPWVNPVALRALLTSYAYVLRRTHNRREARSIEARAAAIHLDPALSAITDVTELRAKLKPAKK